QAQEGDGSSIWRPPWLEAILSESHLLAVVPSDDRAIQYIVPTASVLSRLENYAPAVSGRIGPELNRVLGWNSALSAARRIDTPYLGFIAGGFAQQFRAERGDIP